MSWICPRCNSTHPVGVCAPFGSAETACTTGAGQPVYTVAPEDPVLDRLREPSVHYCTHWEVSAEPPESRELADVHQVLDAWERDPHRTLPGLIALLVQLAEREHALPMIGEQYAAEFLEAVEGDSPAPPGVRALFADEEPS